MRVMRFVSMQYVFAFYKTKNKILSGCTPYVFMQITRTFRIWRQKRALGEILRSDGGFDYDWRLLGRQTVCLVNTPTDRHDVTSQKTNPLCTLLKYSTYNLCSLNIRQALQNPEHPIATLCFNEFSYSVCLTLSIDSIYWLCKLLIMHA